MMEVVSRLIKAALEACFDRGKIDWLPADGYGMPEMFLAECEIEFHPDWIGTSDDGSQSGDYHVVMLGVLCFVDLEDITDELCTYWHSEVLDAEVAG